jgi:hypothetical protein
MIRKPTVSAPKREVYKSTLRIMSHGLLGCQRRPGGLPSQRRDSYCNAVARLRDVQTGLERSTFSPFSVPQSCETPYSSTDGRVAARATRFHVASRASLVLSLYGPIFRSVAGHWLQVDDKSDMWVISWVHAPDACLDTEGFDSFFTLRLMRQ